MGRVSPRKVHRYSLEFKRQAVKLSQLEGVEVQAVADALHIHPFVRSRGSCNGFRSSFAR